MKVKILGNTSYQTYPITDDMVEIDDNLLREIGISKQFVDGQIVDYTNPFVEYDELKSWFNDTYAYKEQKYRRLIALNKLDDDGVDGQTKLTALYEEAEINRARIQELEILISECKDEEDC